MCSLREEIIVGALGQAPQGQVAPEWDSMQAVRLSRALPAQVFGAMISKCHVLDALLPRPECTPSVRSLRP